MTDVRVMHDLKCWPPFFQAILDGRKTFECRRNDRDFMVGDCLLLREYVPARFGEDETGVPIQIAATYTGRECRRLVTYLADDESGIIPPGFCVMSLSLARLGPRDRALLDPTRRADPAPIGQVGPSAVLDWHIATVRAIAEGEDDLSGAREELRNVVVGLEIVRDAFARQSRRYTVELSMYLAMPAVQRWTELEAYFEDRERMIRRLAYVEMMVQQ